MSDTQKTVSNELRLLSIYSLPNVNRRKETTDHHIYRNAQNKLTCTI